MTNLPLIGNDFEFDQFKDLGFEQRTVKVYGKDHPQPRLTKWFGPVPYTYSGLTWNACPMPYHLEKLQKRVWQITGLHFNCALANYYRDGKDTVGWHSDDEPLFGEDPVVASVSFGASRRFVMRRKDDKSVKRELTLTDRSLLLMGEGCQREWQHALPRAKAVAEPRINITFRLCLK